MSTQRSPQDFFPNTGVQTMGVAPEYKTASPAVFDQARLDSAASMPANLESAIGRYDTALDNPDGEKARIDSEHGGPGFFERFKRASERVLALTGVAVVSAGAAYVAPKVADDVVASAYDAGARFEKSEDLAVPAAANHSIQQSMQDAEHNMQ